MIKQLSYCLFILSSFICEGQMVPGNEENIPFLITFGSNGSHEHGDDDDKQAFYFIIPESFKNPFFIRIFDPEIGGLNDEKIGIFDTKTKFSFYGGNNVYSNITGVNANLKSEKPSGLLMQSVEFNGQNTYDNKWYSLGPFNPAEGEYSKEQKGYLFKILAEGLSGDDGNIYKYFISSEANANAPITGANAFTFEYTIRLHESASQISHLYPFVDDKVISLKQHNFDFDGVCELSIYSVSKVAEKAKCSKNDVWAESLHHVENIERQSCMDFQLINNQYGKAKNNNVVIYITNQYGEYLPFMAVPIGNYTPKRIIEVK
jgi:hypothetical protein